MESSIFFSIIIPTFNRPNLIRRALNSIAKQNFKLLEVVVIDDCSTKDYSDVFIEYSDLLITYTRMPLSSGVSAARNTGMSKARGTWFLFLDDDDEFHDGFLCKMYEKITSLGNQPQYFFWANVRKISYSADGLLASQDTIDYSHPKKYGSDNYIKASTIGCSYGLTVNRSVLSKGIHFDTNMNQAEDTDFVLQLMSSQYKPECLADTGVIKHDHIEQRLSSSFDIYSHNKVYERIFEKHKNFLQKYKGIHSSLLHWTTLVHYEASDFESGNQNFKRYFLRDLKNLARLVKASELICARANCRKRIKSSQSRAYSF